MILVLWYSSLQVGKPEHYLNICPQKESVATGREPAHRMGGWVLTAWMPFSAYKEVHSYSWIPVSHERNALPRQSLPWLSFLWPLLPFEPLAIMEEWKINLVCAWAPRWLSRWASAFVSGHDPGVGSVGGVPAQRGVCLPLPLCPSPLLVFALSLK